MFTKDKIKENFEVLICTLFITIIAFFIAWPQKVEGISMKPTFNDGDIVFMSRILKTIKPIEKNDIVICNIKIDNKKLKVIKRVLATPKDHLVIKNGLITINGKKIDGINLSVYYSIDIILGDNQYFILGDNLNFSIDSRYIGPIYKDDIVGKIVF